MSIWAISHVVRGEDHVSNTALQLQMFAAMGARAAAPSRMRRCWPAARASLSKRLGSLGVDAFPRGGDRAARRCVALLARIGTSDPVEPLVDTAPLIASFDFARFGRAPARFDEAELAALNARIVHQLDFDAVADRLPAGMGAAAWEAMRPNLTTRRRGGRLVAGDRRAGRAPATPTRTAISWPARRAIAGDDRLGGRSLARADRAR